MRLCVEVPKPRSWEPGFGTSTDRVFFFFFPALNCRQGCSGNFRIWFSRHGFRDLGSQLWGLDFHTRGFQDRNLKTFFFVRVFLSHFFFALNCCRQRTGFFFFALNCRRRRTWFFFFFFLSALNCHRRRIGFFFSLSVRLRLSVTTCSTLHRSDVGFFTLFNGEDLATFINCSILKTFVPTYLLRGMGLEWRKKKKGRHGRIVSDRHGHPLVIWVRDVHDVTF